MDYDNALRIVREGQEEEVDRGTRPRNGTVGRPREPRQSVRLFLKLPRKDWLERTRADQPFGHDIPTRIALNSDAVVPTDSDV
jgi:hypothetical protein